MPAAVPNFYPVQEHGHAEPAAAEQDVQEEVKKKRKNKKKKKKTNADESVCDSVSNVETEVHPDEQPEFTPLKNLFDDQFFDDNESSEDEGMPDYKIGGYHPIHAGEILLDRYIIIQKLGWGHFSTVWLTKDLKYDSYVAIKVQKSAQHYLEAAYDEVEILD